MASFAERLRVHVGDATAAEQRLAAEPSGRVVRRLRPRAANAMPSVRQFIEHWDAAHPELTELPTMPSSSVFGNINSTGDPTCPDAPVLTPRDPGFVEAVEVGVRVLVLALAQGRGWITYTSCQGHAYAGLDLDPVECHVGLLPRNDWERVAILECVEQLALRLNQEHFSPAIELALMEHALTDGDDQFPAIDLYLAVRSGAMWSDYFANLPDYCAKVAACLWPPEGPGPSVRAGACETWLAD